MARTPASRVTAQSGLPGVKHIAVYGDSLLDNSLAFGVPATWDIHGFGGTSLSNWQANLLANRSPTIILALGTNDANQADPISTWTFVLDRLSQHCVVWPITYHYHQAQIDFDTAMLALLPSYQNVHTVDWNSRVDPAWILPDGTHYNATGNQAYADMLLECAAACP